MNSISTINFSQAVSRLLNNSGSLSHKEQLEAEERCNLRRNSYKAKAQPVKSPQQRADEQISHACSVVANEFTPALQEALAYYMLAGDQFEEVFTSHSTAARNITRSRRSVFRALALAVSHDLAWVTPRFKNKRRTSNVTRLHPIFRHPKCREILKGISSVFRQVCETVPRFLSLWLLFSTPRPSVIPTNVTAENIDIYINKLNVESDIISREVKDTHSRELSTNTQEESHLLPAREGDISSREASRKDIQSRDDYAKASSSKEATMDPQILSQKVAEMRQQLEPQRAAQKALKADAAREISQLLQGRVTATINLSAKGQFHMLRYCDGSMLYGLECLSRYGTIDNRTNYRLFESACIEYSKKNEIKVDADKYDKLLKDMGYYDSQPFCNKITLEEPLSKNKALTKVAERVEAPKPTTPTRTTERNRYASLDPSLKDPIIALALRLGYEDTLNLPQISNQTVDLKE